MIFQGTEAMWTRMFLSVLAVIGLTVAILAEIKPDIFRGIPSTAGMIGEALFIATAVSGFIQWIRSQESKEHKNFFESEIFYRFERNWLSNYATQVALPFAEAIFSHRGLYAHHTIEDQHDWDDLKHLNNEYRQDLRDILSSTGPVAGLPLMRQNMEDLLMATDVVTEMNKLLSFEKDEIDAPSAADLLRKISQMHANHGALPTWDEIIYLTDSVDRTGFATDECLYETMFIALDQYRERLKSLEEGDEEE